MKYVMFYYDKQFDKYVSSTHDLELFTLAFFLKSDCRSFGIEAYREWALDQSRDLTGGNATSLCKTQSGIELCSDLSDEDGACIILTLENFVELLSSWEKITADTPQKIMLSIKDGVAKLEVVNQ